MSQYRLVFTFKDTVSGNGFLARVTISDLALMVHGDTVLKAYIKFRRAFTAVLSDIAARAADFAGFKAEVERFFHDYAKAEERRWHEAGEAIRSGQIKPGADLKREAPEARPVSISVELNLEAQNG